MLTDTAHPPAFADPPAEWKLCKTVDLTIECSGTFPAPFTTHPPGVAWAVAAALTAQPSRFTGGVATAVTAQPAGGTWATKRPSCPQRPHRHTSVCRYARNCTLLSVVRWQTLTPNNRLQSAANMKAGCFSVQLSFSQSLCTPFVHAVFECHS